MHNLVGLVVERNISIVKYIMNQNILDSSSVAMVEKPLAGL